MIHLKATCDRRRTKKDGTHPIVFRITVNGKSRDISSGLSCHDKYWDYKKGTVRDKQEDLKILCKRITEVKLSLLEKIRKFEQDNPMVCNAQEVKEYLCNGKKAEHTLKSFWIEEVNRLHRSNNHSNAIHLESILMRLDKLTSFNIPFQMINYSWLTELETKLREKGLNTNSVSVYLRALRSIYNKAINLNLVDFSHYPFRRFKIKNGNSAPRTLTIEEMRSFFHYTPTNEKLKYAHDMGKLIFMLRGINFTDLALLTNDNVKNDRVVYQRSKTHKLYNVKLIPEAQTLLEAYPSNVQNLLLGILSEDEYSAKKTLPESIQQRRKVLNKWLRKIGKALEIDEPLSTYVFRYSHANICRQLGYSKDLISQSLGHRNMAGAKVTDCYLNDYDMKIIDEMNEHVVSEVMKNKEG